jgi:hypothetical protein
MTVRNSSHQGQSVVPQNKVKIVIDDNSFDGEDLDAGSDYVRNIEPTLSRQRECYFELPRALVKDSFLLGGTPAAACACSSSLAGDSTPR